MDRSQASEVGVRGQRAIVPPSFLTGPVLVFFAGMDRRTDQRADFGLVEFFLVQQFDRQFLQLLAVVFQQVVRLVGGAVQDLDDLGVDQFHRVLAELALLMDFAAQERVFVGQLVADGAQPFAHPPVHHHPPRQVRRPLQVVLRADRGFIIDQQFGRPAAEQDDQVIAELPFGHAEPVLRRHHLRGPQRAAARNDGDFVDGVRAGQQPWR